MAITIIMPQGGQDITEGLVVRWLKKEGEPIRQGEVICEVETEKAVFEVESPADGVLLKIIAPAGAKVPIFAAIGIVGKPGETIESDRFLPVHSVTEKPLDVAAIRRKVAAQGVEAGEKIRASGKARKLASERNVDLFQVTGSGPQGRITAKDVLIHVEKHRLAVQALRGRTVPLSRMRESIARRVLQSKQTIPHFYVTVSADVTDTLEMRKRLQREAGENVSITAIITKASALALREFPAMNCRLQEDQIVYLDDINIGIAVTLDDGVMVPILARADQLSLTEASRQSGELASRARQGRVSGVEPACLTVSNLGMLGIDGFTAIINPPEAGILAVGRIQKQPVVSEGTDLRIRDMVSLTLSVDHRVVDGALAARFLGRIRHHLENPVNLTD
jgi:pyruvate dehydrogenase E2 component (dihydrolipoamide acetyltransferase)